MNVSGIPYSFPVLKLQSHTNRYFSIIDDLSLKTIKHSHSGLQKNGAGIVRGLGTNPSTLLGV